MLYGWDKFKGWKVLEFFLLENKKIHANGLAKILKIGVSTAQTYLTGYEKEGVLEKEKTANVILYWLKESALTAEIRKAYFISKIMRFASQFHNENQYVTSLAVFGSHAKGSFDEKSDIDLIAISQEKKVSIASLKRLEKNIGKEPKIQVFSIAEWKRLVSKKDHFALSIIKNNILLFGDPL